MNGEVPASLKYQDWLKTQTPAFQNEVLGKGKAELFRRGVPVERFVDKHLKVKSIGQIINQEGLAGTNLTSLRFAAQQRIGAGKAVAADRIRAAWSKLPEPLRKHLGILQDATAPLVGAAKKAALPIANAGPNFSSWLVKKSGASATMASRGTLVGVAGDWTGFALAGVVPILGVVPPGSMAVAAFGLGNLGQKALRSGVTRVRNIFRSRTRLAELKSKALTNRAVTRAQARRKAKEVRREQARKTREANRQAQEQARQRGEL